jgi:hypothetical protein
MSCIKIKIRVFKSSKNKKYANGFDDQLFPDIGKSTAFFEVSQASTACLADKGSKK